LDLSTARDHADLMFAVDVALDALLNSMTDEDWGIDEVEPGDDGPTFTEQLKSEWNEEERVAEKSPWYWQGVYDAEDPDYDQS